MQSLHQISRQMSFGHTNYIPPDETRNFRALVPVSDEIKIRLGRTPKVNFELHSEEEVKHFEEYIKSHPLPAPNYRELQWTKRSSRASRLNSIYNSQRSSELKHWELPGENYTISPEETIKAEIDLSKVEATYRSKYGIPFRIDPLACHIVDEPLGMAHTMNLKLKFGLDKVFLNDPAFMDSMRKKIEEEEKMKEEESAKNREANEVVRAAVEKKKFCFALDEYFESMQFPRICGSKPWLWKCEKENEITGDCLPGDVGIVLPPIRPKCDFGVSRQKYTQLWAETNTINWNLSPSDGVSINSRQDSTMADEPNENQEQKDLTNFDNSQEVKDKVDRMDEVTLIADLFKVAKDVVKNYSERNNYFVKDENSERNSKERLFEFEDNEDVDTDQVL